MENLKYVSPDYQRRLDRLADQLVTQRHAGYLALDDTVEFPAITDDDLIERTAYEIGREYEQDRAILEAL